MKKIAQKAKTVTKKSVASIQDEGFAGFTKRSAQFVYYRKFPERKKKYYRDILFVNGCTLPHPSRYRVDHQVEQLKAGGLTVDSIFYENLNLEQLKYYRGFVFYRCPITDTVRQFIEEAKKHNKTCFFDIDDLVIDQKYTDQIKYVNQMSQTDKALYDDGVNRMRTTLQLCDYAITTTSKLKDELEKYTEEVFINRNVASDEMVAHSLDALKHTHKDNSKIVIGYFSGSITHNEDFELVVPDLVKILYAHKNVRLKIAGILDIPPELSRFKNRIETTGFMSWRTMPKAIATCDINIAPLTDSIFNEAKSENKWTEAALVKVPTIASNIGAFKDVIENDKTGILVNDDWFVAIDALIKDQSKRKRLAEAAHKSVLQSHTTIGSSQNLTGYIQKKLARNIAFALPSTDISGGVNVILKHADILQKNGWDVTLIDTIDKKTLKNSQKEYQYRYELPGYNVITECKVHIEAYFDTMVATLWSTVKYIKKYPDTLNRLYLVQNFETDFYVHGEAEPRMLANSTYSDQTDIKYITISLWCKKWLKEKFSKNARYAPNGIDLKYYEVRKRNFEGRIQILVEGDSKSEYKNTDEAFRIIEKLDPKQYEISYLSYRKEPKKWYRVDHFYNRIAPEKVGEVYAKCDILIKTSLVESFSYPPLEMMATGGVSVVLPNGGNVEYLRDDENCLFYTPGDIDDGVAKVKELASNKKLRNRLIKNGLETAFNYSWEHQEKAILGLYE